MGVKRRTDTGRWQVDLRSRYVGIYDDEHTARMMFAAGMRQCELGKPLDAVVRELRGATSSPTMTEYAAGWLPTCTTSDHAEAMYRHRLAWDRLEPYIGRRQIAELTTDDVKRAVDALNARYAPKTVAGTIATLKMMLSDAQDAGLVSRNAAKRLRNLREVGATSVTALSSSTFRRLIAAATEQSAPMIAIAGLTGMRIGELLALRWTDITEDGAVVERQVRARDRAEAPTKTGRRRIVPLTDEARAWLARQREVSVRPDSPYVFPNFYGRPLPRTQMREHFDAAAREVGVRATPHQYRHSFGSWALQASVPVHVVAEWMGHSPEMLMRVYAHELAEARTDNIGLLHAYMNGTTTGLSALHEHGGA